MSNKTYTSKSGKQFSIVNIPAPAKDDIVFFTSTEFDYMKSQMLKPEEFDFLWNAKKEDYTYPIIPDAEESKAKTLADFYVPNIKNIILGKAKKEGEE